MFDYEQYALQKHLLNRLLSHNKELLLQPQLNFHNLNQQFSFLSKVPGIKKLSKLIYRETNYK